MQEGAHHCLVTTLDPADAPTGLREAKKARTRASLARAALQLVAEDGLDATTVEAIAARADVSPRTFFNYFDSKDEAVVHLGADRFRRLLGRLFSDERPATSAQDPILLIRDEMLGFLRESESDSDAAADDELVRAALDRDPSLFGALHTSMSAISAEFEAAIAAHYASETDRERARIGLSVAIGLTQTAMQNTCGGNSNTPVAELVAHYFSVLDSAFTTTAFTRADERHHTS